MTKPRSTRRTRHRSSPGSDTLQFKLRFTRAQNAADPYEFQFGSQQYICQREDGGVKVATLDWNHDLFAELEEAANADADPAVIQRLGNRLRRFLETTDWPSYEQRIASAVTPAGPRQGVRITIVSNAAELYALPWEFLTLEATGQHLGELPDVMFRYAWPGTETTPERPSPRPERTRVLLAWSESNGAVPHQEHRAAIRDACAHAGIPFQPDGDEIARVSYERLGDALAATDRGGPATILHLLCHGVTDRDTVALGFHGEHGLPDVVDAARLRQLLAPHAHRIRLVVLCACHSGDPGTLGNHLGSIAQNLHRVGIQAVIASRFPLSARASTRFTRTFYETLLAAPARVEHAFQAGRTEVLRRTSGRDWFSFQLYARPEDERKAPIWSLQMPGWRLAIAAVAMTAMLIWMAFGPGTKVLAAALATVISGSPRAGDPHESPPRIDSTHASSPLESVSLPSKPVPPSGLSNAVLTSPPPGDQANRPVSLGVTQQPAPRPPRSPEKGRNPVRGPSTMGRAALPPQPEQQAAVSQESERDGLAPKDPGQPTAPNAATENSALLGVTQGNDEIDHTAVTSMLAAPTWNDEQLRSEIGAAFHLRNFARVLASCEKITDAPVGAEVYAWCCAAACEQRDHEVGRIYFLLLRPNKRYHNRCADRCAAKGIYLNE